MAERDEDYPLPTRPAATANRSRAARKAPVPSIPASMMSAFLIRSKDTQLNNDGSGKPISLCAPLLTLFPVSKKRGRKSGKKVDYEKHRLADQPTWQVSCPRGRGQEQEEGSSRRGGGQQEERSAIQTLLDMGQSRETAQTSSDQQVQVTAGDQ